MKKRKIIRALRDEDFYLSLSEEERAQLPENPAGVVDLREEDLREAAGAGSAACSTYYTCKPTMCSPYSAGSYCCC